MKSAVSMNIAFLGPDVRTVDDATKHSYNDGIVAVPQDSYGNMVQFITDIMPTHIRETEYIYIETYWLKTEKFIEILDLISS